MGLMQMGPQSAGSEPGPACYDQGGEKPTTTDANLVLGYLNPDGLVGGRLPLNVAKARRAIKTHLADPLGISVEKITRPARTVVSASARMVHTARELPMLKVSPAVT